MVARTFWSSTMKNASLPWQSLYFENEEIAPSKKLTRGFLLLHLIYGILHFPLYLAEGYGDILPTVIFLLQHIIYPLTAVIGFIGIVSAFSSKSIKNSKNPRRFLEIILLGEAISSFLVFSIEAIDTQSLLYYWYVVLGNILLDTAIDILSMALFLAIVYLVLKRVKAKTTKEVPRAMSVAVGVLCGFYLFASEIVTSIYFIIDYLIIGIGEPIYLDEILYMIMIYAVYGVAAYFCYLFTRKGAKAVLAFQNRK